MADFCFYPHDEYHEGLVTIVLYVYKLSQVEIFVEWYETILLYVYKLSQVEIFVDWYERILLYVYKLSQVEIFVDWYVRILSWHCFQKNFCICHWIASNDWNVKNVGIMLKIWE